jgi:hypothetical protein
MIRDAKDDLGLEPGVFDLAFESFWDLYTFHHLIEVSPKKMQTWIKKIKLQPNEMTGVPAQDAPEPEEGQEAAEGTPEQPPYDSIKAVIRIRIAKKIPEAAENSEGEMVEPEYKEEELEDMPIDDKCLGVTTNDGEQGIFCIN